MSKRWREFWLDKLSLDKNGWMDAIPKLPTDEKEYRCHISVIETGAVEELERKLAKAKEMFGRISQLEEMALNDTATALKKHNVMASFAREALDAINEEEG